MQEKMIQLVIEKSELFENLTNYYKLEVLTSLLMTIGLMALSGVLSLIGIIISYKFKGRVKYDIGGFITVVSIVSLILLIPLELFPKIKEYTMITSSPEIYVIKRINTDADIPKEVAAKFSTNNSEQQEKIIIEKIDKSEIE